MAACVKSSGVNATEMAACVKDPATFNSVIPGLNASKPYFPFLVIDGKEAHVNSASALIYSCPRIHSRRQRKFTHTENQHDSQWEILNYPAERSRAHTAGSAHGAVCTGGWIMNSYSRSFLLLPLLPA